MCCMRLAVVAAFWLSCAIADDAAPPVQGTRDLQVHPLPDDELESAMTADDHCLNDGKSAEQCALSALQLRASSSAAASQSPQSPQSPGGNGTSFDESLLEKSRGASAAGEGEEEHESGEEDSKPTGPQGCGNRQDRLRQYGLRTLYHQTSPQSGRSIMATGFNPAAGRSHSKWAIAGVATYFATNLQATSKKAWYKGFCIQAQVYVGHAKDEPRDPKTHTLAELNRNCYDSVHINRGYNGGDEYAIFAKDQMPKKFYKHVPCPGS